MKAYIAFSVHGKEEFTVVTGEISAEQADILSKGAIITIDGLPGQFSKGVSRRPNYKASDGFKLLWSELNNRKTGQPYLKQHAANAKLLLLLNKGWTQVAGTVLTRNDQERRNGN